MKKLLFVPALAALAMVSCTDETIVNDLNSPEGSPQESRQMSFSTFVGKNKRATEVTINNLDSFRISALFTQTGVDADLKHLFDTAKVYETAKGSKVYTMDSTFYWPYNATKDNKVTFLAFGRDTCLTKLVSDISASRETRVADGLVTDSMKFHVKIEDSLHIKDTQHDIVYAGTKAYYDPIDKPEGAQGEGWKKAKDVKLNFKHALSQICVKVKNTNDDLMFDIFGWKVGSILKQGDFVFGETVNADSTGHWSFADDTKSDTITYTSNGLLNGGKTDSIPNFRKTDVAQLLSAITDADTQTPKRWDGGWKSDSIQANMMLIPQKLTLADPLDSARYNGTANTRPHETYIGVEMRFKYTEANGGDILHDRVWAIWPIPTEEWLPGKKYTYVIDLGTGGYYEQDPDIDTDKPYHTIIPILGKPIEFGEVIVEDWEDGGDDIDPDYAVDKD